MMSDLLKILEPNIVDQYKMSDDILTDVSAIIDAAQASAYRAVNIALLQRNGLLGKRLELEELAGDRQKDYGLKVIKRLAKELNQKYGKGFTKTNLYHFYNFYKEYPDIFHTACGKSSRLLSWSHYRVLLTVFDKNA